MSVHYGGTCNVSKSYMIISGTDLQLQPVLYFESKTCEHENNELWIEIVDVWLYAPNINSASLARKLVWKIYQPWFARKISSYLMNTFSREHNKVWKCVIQCIFDQIVLLQGSFFAGVINHLYGDHAVIDLRVFREDTWWPWLLRSKFRAWYSICQVP